MCNCCIDISKLVSIQYQQLCDIDTINIVSISHLQYIVFASSVRLYIRPSHFLKLKKLFNHSTYSAETW